MLDVSIAMMHPLHRRHVCTRPGTTGR
jgi:hypothetical protein